MTFREDPNGKDALCSINVPNHVDIYEIRSKLKELDLLNFTLIPTPKFTKIVISDRDGELLPTITQLAKTYDTQLKLTQGSSQIIREADFNSRINSFDEKNRGVSRSGNRDRPDQQGRRTPALNSNLGRNRGGVTTKPKKIARNLHQAITPKIESPAAIQEKLTIEAIKTIRELLDLSPNKRQFTDGQIVAGYDGSTKTLSLVDLHTSSIKMEATHDGKKWRSNPQHIGGMKEEDIPFLKAALVMAKAKSSESGPDIPSHSQSLFAEHVREPSQPNPVAYQASPVER